MDKREVERFVDLLSCRSLKFLFTFLEVDIGANPIRDASCDKVLRKVSKKLTTLKHTDLSLARRMCLINYVLSSILFFSIFKIN